MKYNLHCSIMSKCQDFSNIKFILFSAFLRNFVLRQDLLSGDVPPHLAQPCYVALEWAKCHYNWLDLHPGCSLTSDAANPPATTAGKIYT